ncbi:MAG: hypothetical protein LBH25_15350 [Fibromonadaceae bacterium]|nr:hypothetical protein [Fibromonadaceae bacterium]
MKILTLAVFSFAFAFAGEKYGVYDSQGNRVSTFEAERHELPEKARQIKSSYPGKTVYVSSMQKGKGSKPSSRYRYKTGSYVEAARKETFAICPPDKKTEGTWVSEHSVALNAENCLSVQTPDLAGTIDVLFVESSGRTDTIKVLVEQSYIQMGDYSHRMWVNDFECKRMVTYDEFHLLCPDNYDKIGHYENRSYRQSLIVDKTKLTMSDAQYYSKVGNIGISPFVLEKYEKPEESKLPLVDEQAWRFANERSKKENLDTAYIRIHPHSKDARKFILLGDSSLSYYNCESCIMIAIDTSASGYRVPFKEEWFFLMRAGASAKYYWGNEEDTKIVSRYEWVRPIELKPVAKLYPNRFGLYDIISNSDESVLGFHKKYEYWDFGTPCSDEKELIPECDFIKKIGMQRQYTKSSKDCELKPNAKKWECGETKQKTLTERVYYEGFRLLRKTPKLHKLEKF